MLSKKYGRGALKNVYTRRQYRALPPLNSDYIIVITGSPFMLSNPQSVPRRITDLLDAALDDCVQQQAAGNHDTPRLVGICFGFQYILRYFGSTVRALPNGRGHPSEEVLLYRLDDAVQNTIAPRTAHEHHYDFVVPHTIDLSNFLTTGIMIRPDRTTEYEPASVQHKTMPIAGVQYHIGADQGLWSLLLGEA